MVHKFCHKSALKKEEKNLMKILLKNFIGKTLLLLFYNIYFDFDYIDK